MTKYVHIVQVHPVENGLPNLHKVQLEQEFDTEQSALDYIKYFNTVGNAMCKTHGSSVLHSKAVYLGRVNDDTGELE